MKLHNKNRFPSSPSEWKNHAQSDLKYAKEYSPIEPFSKDFQVDRQYWKQDSIDFNKKRPVVAAILALVPGAIIRGAGHIYIRHYKTGLLLFSLSTGSIAFVASAGSGAD